MSYFCRCLFLCVVEMDRWEKEMKTYLFERKVEASDHTRSPEEITKGSGSELGPGVSTSGGICE